MRRLLLLRSFAIAAVLLLPAASAQADIVVANTTDCSAPGCGSLRDAINQANGNGVPETIDMTGLTGVITLLAPLPTITVPLTILGPDQDMDTFFTLTLNGGAFSTVTLNTVADVTMFGVQITDGLTKTGAGTLTVESWLADYPGDTTILAGTLRTDGDSADFILSQSSMVSVAAGALLDLNSFNQQIAGLSGDGDVSIGSGTVGLFIFYPGAATFTFNGNIDGDIDTGLVVYSDAGTQVLTGTNTFAGSVIVENGALRLTGTDTIAASVLTGVEGGGTLDLAGTNQRVNDLQTEPNAIVNLGVGTLTINVTGDLGDSEHFGDITGAGNVVKIGPGAFVIFDTNTYTGNTRIEEGIYWSVDDDLLAPTSTMTINGGSFFLDGLQTIAGLSGSGGSVDMCDCAGLTVNQAGNSVFFGTIDGEFGGSFAKDGPGILTLAGANTYIGATDVNGGTLLLTGSIDAASEVTVAAGATLGGTGIVNGGISVVGGRLSPGFAPGAGRLTAGAVSFLGGTTAIELNGTVVATQYDQLRVTGSAALDGNLSLSVTFAPAQGQTFTIVDNQSGSAISGTFSGLPQNATVTAGSRTFRISYTGGDGNDVTLTSLNATPTLTANGSPNVTLGGVISATANLAGGSDPTGTLTFRAYGPADPTCARPIFASDRSVSGNGTYSSAEFKPASAGEYKWIVSYGGDGPNAAVSTACGAATQVLALPRSNQTITFVPVPAKTLSDSPVTVSATASSGLTVTFSSLTEAVCAVAGTSVTLKAIGTCTIAADQIGNASFNAAPRVTQSFAVTAGCGGLSLTPSQLPVGIVAMPYNGAIAISGGGTAPFTYSLSGTLPGGLTFSSSNGAVAGTPTARGSFPITVTGTDANACQVSKTFAIAISAERRVLVGAGGGGAGASRAFNLAGTAAVATYNSGPGFNGGTSVAQGDVNGDGVADVITGAGPGASPAVTVFDGSTGAARLAFFAFAPTFLGGVEVAAGDITGDGLPEILVAPQCASGAPSTVRAFDGRSAALVREYSLSPTTVACGLHVAAGDVNGDGIADVVVGSAGLGSFVQVFDGWSGVPRTPFFPYSAAFTGGVFVAAGDVNGDGFADIVTGAGPGGTPHVRVFDGVTGSQIPGALGSFHAYFATFPGGVRVAAGDLDGDGRAEIITGPGAGGGPDVRIYDGATSSLISALFAFDPSFGGGVYVAGPPQTALMSVDVAARTTGNQVRVAGWALRELAIDTVGNDAIDVWAYPVGAGTPIYVGGAPSRTARPDVATIFGGEFLNSGFDVNGTLAAGTYDLVVFARNARTLKFDQVRVIRVTVN